MPGLLSQGPNPSQPQEGMQPSPQAPSEEGVSPEAQPFYDLATQITYSEENFTEIIEVFSDLQSPDEFPELMAAAVVDTVEDVEDQAGEELPIEILAEVGAKIFEDLTSDLFEGGLLEGVTEDHLNMAVGEAAILWEQAYPDRFDREEFEAVVGQMMEEDEIMAQEDMAMAEQEAVAQNQPQPPMGA